MYTVHKNRVGSLFDLHCCTCIPSFISLIRSVSILFILYIICHRRPAALMGVYPPWQPVNVSVLLLLLFLLNLTNKFFFFFFFFFFFMFCMHWSLVFLIYSSVKNKKQEFLTISLPCLIYMWNEKVFFLLSFELRLNNVPLFQPVIIAFTERTCAHGICSYRSSRLNGWCL